MYVTIRTSDVTGVLREGTYAAQIEGESDFRDLPVHRLLDDQPSVSLGSALQVVECWIAGDDGSADLVTTVVGDLIADDHQSTATAPLRTVLWYSIPEAEHDDFESWYAQEHVHFLMREPSWWRCRRVRLHRPSDGNEPVWSHVAIHDLAGPEAFSSPLLAEARVAPGQMRCLNDRASRQRSRRSTPSPRIDSRHQSRRRSQRRRGLLLPSTAPRHQERHMRIGIRIPACTALTEFTEAVQLVERHGFDTVWMPDSQLLWRDTFAALAFAADATSRIRLGTGVTNLRTRHPSVLASAANTAAELAPDRFRLTIGTGDSAVKLIGDRPTRLAETREGVKMVRALMGGEPWSVDGNPVWLRDARGTVPVYLAGSGPRNVELAGEIADGALLLGGAAPSLIERNVAGLRAGAERAGRAPEDVPIAVAAFCHVTDDPERDARLLKPLVATVAMTGGAQALAAAGIEVDVATIPASPYPDYSHAEDLQAAIDVLDPVVSTEAALRFAQHFCLFGSAGEISEQMGVLGSLGVDEVYLRHLGSYEIPYELIDAVATQILPEFSSSTAAAGSTPAP